MIKKLLLTVVLTVVTTLGLMAQITTAGISGRVVGVSTDKEEALPGATIVATHVPSGTTYGTATVADGRYTIPGMRVGGPYTIKISFVGYKEEVFENLTLNLGVIATLDVKLVEEGTQLEEVVITSDRNDIFSADRTGASASYGTSMINSVPTIGRTINDVVKYNAFSNGSSFAGQDSRFNNFTIDGSVFNNGFGLGSAAQAGGRTGTTPVSLDSFDEIQLNVAPFDVRQSGFAGASINAVTRSGTNQVQASVYDLFRNTNTIGRNAADALVAPLTVKENTVGFRIGAPIIKNKLFIFGNYEQFTSSVPAETYSLNRGQSGGNVSRVTEADMIDVTNFVQQKLGWDPGSLDGFNNNTTSKKGLIRLDYNINQNHKLAVRFSTHNSQTDQLISSSNSSNTAGFGNRTNSQTAMSPQNTGYVIMDNTRSGAVELNSNFGSKIANKLIGTYNFQNEDRKYKSPLFPTIEIQDAGSFNTNSTYISLGMDPFTPSNKLRYSTLNITDNVTYFAGDHTLTAGVAFEKFKSDNLFFPSSNGVYVYRNIADFKTAVNDYIANPAATTSPVTVLRYNLRYSLLPNGQDPWQTLKTSTYSFYVQDEWQVNYKFKLTAGLRGDVFAYDKSTAESFYNPVVGALTFKDENGNDYGVNTGAFPKTKVLLSPRIGFNYDVNGNKMLQIRGGSGIFVSRIPQVLVSNQLGNNGVNTALISATGTNYPFRVSPADLPPAVQPNPSNVNLSALPPYVVNATDGGLKYPSVWKTNVAVDYKLPFGFIATGEIIYNKVINGLRYVDANLKAPSATFAGDDSRDQFPAYGGNGATATSPVNVARFYNTAVTNVFVLKNTNKGSAYTFTAKLEKPASKGISGMAAYTYGLARDVQSVGSTVQANMPTVSGQNYLGLAYADNDLRHRVIGYANFRIPSGNEDKGGMSMITIGFSSQSGAKYSYIYSNDLNGDGQTNDLVYVPNSASEMTFVAQTVNGKTFTPADQQAAWDSYIDNNPYLKTRRGKYAERNGGFSPWTTRIDVTFVREFYIRAFNQKHTFQLRADILNFMNLLSPKWGIGWTAPGGNFNNISPIAVANGGNNSPTYRLATQVVNGQTVLIQDSFLKGSSLGNLWQAQIGVRYILN
jgi:hypothetical protein